MCTKLFFYNKKLGTFQMKIIIVTVMKICKIESRAQIKFYFHSNREQNSPEEKQYMYVYNNMALAIRY